MKTISVYEFYLACKAGLISKTGSKDKGSFGNIYLARYHYFIFLYSSIVTYIFSKTSKKKLQIKPCTVIREYLVYMTTYPYLMISSINDKPSLATVLEVV